MTAELRQRLMLAGIGVIAGLAVVAAYFGSGDLLKHARSVVPDEAAPRDAPRASQRAADLPGSGTAPAPPAGGNMDEQGRQAAIDPRAAPDAVPERPAQASPARGANGHGAVPEGATVKDPGAPSLDIVRVEPGGEAVIAGRGAANAAVELLRDNKPVARVVADDTGQFAIVPPTLPTGNSTITLRATSPDGRMVEGRESVAVVVAHDRKTQPLVAVSEPDKPTRVLSQPQAPEQARTATAGKDEGKNEARSADKSAGKTEDRTAALDPRGRGGESGPVRVVSVDAQDGGRLFVTGQGAAWASLRLYLNDTLVASGRSGADGRVAFTIGRGVRAGNYQVRIDQVEGESGKVRNRAQVAFAFPAQLAAKEPAKEAAKEPAKEAAKKTAKAAEVPSVGRTDAVGKPVAPHETPASSAAGTVSDMAAGSAAPQPEASGAKSDTRVSSNATPPGPAKDGPAPATPAPPAQSSSRAAVSAAPVASKSGEQPGAVFVPEIDTARIIRGDNLWQISRRTYGDGKRYTVIYDANRDQIRDPDLIYPGQIFVMPKDAPKDAPAADRQGARRG